MDGMAPLPPAGARKTKLWIGLWSSFTRMPCGAEAGTLNRGTDLLTWNDGKQIVPAAPHPASMPFYELLERD